MKLQTHHGFLRVPFHEGVCGATNRSAT